MQARTLSAGLLFSNDNEQYYTELDTLSVVMPARHCFIALSPLYAVVPWRQMAIRRRSVVYFLNNITTKGASTMIARIMLILLCLGILSTVNGCYIEPYPYGYYAPRPYVYAYPRAYVYAYPYRYYRPYYYPY